MTTHPVPLPALWRIWLLSAAIVFCLTIDADGIRGQTPDDHGNTPATATSVTLGESDAGRIDPGDDIDVFEFDLSRTSGMTDIWAYTTGEVDTVGGLYDSEGTLLIYNDDGYFSDYRQSFSLRRTVGPGIYYLVIASYRPEPGDYVLHTQAVTEPGDSLISAKRLQLGSPTGATIQTREDTDFFRLDLTRSTHTIIEAINSSYLSLDAKLLDPNGNELGENIYPLAAFYGHRHGQGFHIREHLNPGTYYVKVTPEGRPGTRTVPYAIRAVEDGNFATFADECSMATTALNNSSIRDPLYACQWHLESSEYVDINVESAWDDGVMGEGVNVALVDQGMDYRHEDLKDNVELALNHDYGDEGDIYNRWDHHGTHVAGIIAARDNAVGTRGVAPRATIYGYNLLEGYATLFELLDAMTRNSEVTAVSNSSWGNRDSVRAKRAGTLWEQAIENGLNNGYGGKGTFYVFSAGNGHLLGDDSNLDEFANFYGVTAACSVQGWGARAPYSETGANLWVCAPSNERPGVLGLGGRFGIVTTENSDNYAHEFGGTTAAAPVVSGVAALMRDANPDLTWRDLKLILAASAQKNDPDNAGWQEGHRKYRAGSATDRYHFNHGYGFGLVDAGAAVELAKEWVTVPDLEQGGASSGELGVLIPDAPIDGAPRTVSSSITLEKGIGFVEFVEVNIALRHRSFRDLEIELVSPSGAVSRIAVPHDTSTDLFTYSDFIPLYGSFRFGSARHLGEDPNGDWTLRVTDRIHAGEGTLESWEISIYGHKPAPDAPSVSSVTSGRGSLAVQWAAQPDTSDFEVIAYDLRYKRSDDDPDLPVNWATLEEVWRSADGGSLAYEIPGLTGGTQYDVQLRAINKWGAGDWSDIATGTPENALPTFSEGSTTTRSVLENTPHGGSVGDPVEAADDGTLTYTLGGPDEDLFEIGPMTGQITVGSGTSLDYESGIREYSVVVTATDDFLASTSTSVTITVENVSLGMVGDQFDADQNELIDGDEVINAINEYLMGLISREDALNVVDLYLSG